MLSLSVFSKELVAKIGLKAIGGKFHRLNIKS